MKQIIQHKRFYTVATIMLFLFLAIVQPAKATTLQGYLEGEVLRGTEIITTAAEHIPVRGPFLNPYGVVGAIVVGTVASYMAGELDGFIQKSRVQMGSNTEQGLPYPTGWTDASHPPDPGGGQTISDLQYCTGGLPANPPSTGGECGGSHWSSLADAATGICTGAGFASGTPTTVVGYHWGARCFYSGGSEYTPSPAYPGLPITGTLSCQTGYAWDGTQCKLTDSPKVQWPSDGIPTYVPKTDGSGFTPSQRDTADGYGDVTGTITYSGTDSLGHPYKTTISDVVGGGTQTQTLTQYTDTATGSTSVNDYTITTDSSGHVTNVTNYNTTNTSITTYSTPPTGTAPAGGTSGTPSITLPTDYARDATVSATNSKLDTISGKLDVNGDPGTAADTAVTNATSDINNKLSIGPNGVNVDAFNPTERASLLPGMFAAVPDGGTCVDPTLNIAGHTGTIELCRFWEPWRDGIGWLLWVVTGVYLWRRVSGLETG